MEETKSKRMPANMEPIPGSVLRKQEWLGFKVLLKSLGWVRAMGLGLTMKRRLSSGAPWGRLDPSADVREDWSRAQVGPAIVLYQLLKENSHPEPLNLMREVVVTGAVPWMKWAIGTIEPDAYREMSDVERDGWFKGKSQRFLNMRMKSHATGEEHVQFEVEACSFPSLCQRTNVPELASVFCAVDAHYFGGVQQGIALTRPTTIAGGDSGCSFHLAWDDVQASRKE